MAIAGTEPTDFEAQRAELDAVLHSEHFTRAPTLALLLKYLCEKLFAGEAYQIKEYSVGVEVFHRSSSFDQNADSIVRVEANRLRKRLAAYYAGEGAAHRLQISIPVGQYVPEFISAAPRQTEAAGADIPAATPSEIDGAPTGKAKARLRLSGARNWWPVAALSLLCVVLGFALLMLRQRSQNPPPSGSNQPAAQPAESELGPPVGEEVRILAGSSRSFVDHAGKLWNADTGFEGGTAVKSSVQNIWRTQNPDFYRTSRQGNFRYSIPLKKGIYELRLHFAETVYDPESTGTGGEGSRLMTVRANGKTLLTRFDVVDDAGASRTADVKVFTDIQPAADGHCTWSSPAKKASRPFSPPSRFCPDTGDTSGRCACSPARRRITPMIAIGGARITTSRAGNWRRIQPR